MDNAIESAVVTSNTAASGNGPSNNRRETIFGDSFHNMLLPSIPLRRLRPTGRGAAVDTPPRAATPVSLQAVANVRPLTPYAARSVPSSTEAPRLNRTVISLNRDSATVQPTLITSSRTRSSGNLPIRIVNSRPTLLASTPSSANRSATTRSSNVSSLGAVQPNETISQNVSLPPSITVTAKQIPRQDGQLQYHITNSAGLFFGDDILPHVMQKVTTHFRRAHALALHRNEETPTEVTFRMPTPT